MRPSRPPLRPRPPRRRRGGPGLNGRREGAKPTLLLAAAAALLLACPAQAAGGQKLWDLGDLVDDNPLTTFCMFTMVVVLSICVEVSRHHAEHSTTDPHRRKALEAIYSELMMVGVVSFGLILGAELGLTDLRLRKPFCTPDNASSSSSSSAAAAGSDVSSGSQPPPADTDAVSLPCGSSVGSTGSGSGDDCYVGFDLLMFEYAHLVLFFMGIMYCVFIQVALRQLDSHCQTIAHLEEKTLMEWSGPKGFRMPSVFGVMGIGCTRESWARAVLALRAAMVIKLQDELREAADPEEGMLEHCMAEYLHRPIPAPRPKAEDVQRHFSVARFAKIGSSEVMIDLLHVPVIVWLSIIMMAAMDAFRVLGLSISTMMLVSAFFGPTLASLVLWRMSEHLLVVVRNAVGHPNICDHDYITARGERGSGEPVKLQNQLLRGRGNLWAEQDRKQRTTDPFCEVDHPWSELEGCCPDEHILNFLDPLDPQALRIQIQVVVFASCFYVGQIMMLSSLMKRMLGIPVLLVLWILPMLPLCIFIPRAMLIYTLVHRTSEPPREWLVYAIKPHDDPRHDHGHGHKEHDSPRESGMPWLGKVRSGKDEHRQQVLRRLRDALVKATTPQQQEKGLEEALLGGAAPPPPGAAESEALGPALPTFPVGGFRAGDAVVFVGVPSARRGVAAGARGLVAATTKQGCLHVVVEGVGLLTDLRPTALRLATPVSTPPSTPPDGEPLVDSDRISAAVRSAVRDALSAHSPSSPLSGTGNPLAMSAGTVSPTSGWRPTESIGGGSEAPQGQQPQAGRGRSVTPQHAKPLYGV